MPPQKGDQLAKYHLICRDKKSPDAGVYDFVQAVIDRHHEQLEGLHFLIAWKVSGDEQRGGKVAKLDEITRQATGADFVLVLVKATWEAFENDVREAMVDSLLADLHRKENASGEERFVALPGVDGTLESGRRVPVLQKVAPPRADHAAVLRRRGIWRADLKSLGAAFTQAAQIAIAFESDPAGDESSAPPPS